MQTRKLHLTASVLASVLVVSTLMLLSVLLVIELWNFDLTRYSLYHRGEQARVNVESGFLLYCQDSTLKGRLGEDSTVLLFGEQEDSRVRFSREAWGLYEVVNVANGERMHATRLLGKRFESDKQATLYVPENNRAFSLTGKTCIEGEVYLSRNGISYTQVRSEFFKGKALPLERVKTSDDHFPGLESETLAVVDDLMDYPGEREWLEGGGVFTRGFREPLARVETGEYLSGTRVKGHVILYASSVFIEQDNDLENVIVVARKVEIADGFTGSLQIFACDTIILGSQVCLKPGSGLYVRQENEGCLVRLGEHCELNGYVVVTGEVSEGELKRAVYHQPETSRVRGLVYVDGVAEVHGYVTGSLYARECYYFAAEGYYSGILYNALLPGNGGMAYPLWMQGPHERRVVKWLD